MVDVKLHKNRHPVDELSDVRAQLRALKDREDELRAHLLTCSDRVGDEYVATVAERQGLRLDRGKLEKRFGKAAVDACCVASSVRMVRLARKAQSGGLFE